MRGIEEKIRKLNAEHAVNLEAYPPKVEKYKKECQRKTGRYPKADRARRFL